MKEFLATIVEPNTPAEEANVIALLHFVGGQIERAMVNGGLFTIPEEDAKALIFSGVWKYSRHEEDKPGVLGSALHEEFKRSNSENPNTLVDIDPALISIVGHCVIVKRHLKITYLRRC